MPPTGEDVLRRFPQLSPDTICAALGPLLVDGRRERIEAVLAARLVGVTALIENLHDPHNGAAALRSAEAFGLQAVHVVESEERFRFSSDVTKGCEKWLSIHRHPSFDDARARLHARGFALYAAVPGASTRLDALDFSGPAAIVVGNEHDGLTSAAVAGSDVRFAIPMDGMTQSLNLSVATAVVLAHAVRQRRAALGHASDLDEAERARLRARFYAASVRGAAQILSRVFGPPAEVPVLPGGGAAQPDAGARPGSKPEP